MSAENTEALIIVSSLSLFALNATDAAMSIAIIAVAYLASKLEI